MRNRYPDQQTHLPLSLSVYNQLQWASCHTAYQKEDWEIATEAIDEWVRRHDPNALPGPQHAGYQWKRLFLPDGTVLRTVYRGKNYHCVVEGDRLIHETREVSPSGFVNAVGGIRRNAWKCTWVLLPDSKQWKLADSLRDKDRTRAKRPPVPAIEEPPRPHNVADRNDVPPPAAKRPLDTRASSKPIRVRRRARPTGAALAAFKARYSRPAVAAPIQLSRGDVPQSAHARSDRTPARLARPEANAPSLKKEDLFIALLRKELLPLLYRMGEIDSLPPDDLGSAWSGASGITPTAPS